ncbi:MAG: sialidase family protein [Planctomycetota bacterium]
MTFLRSWLIVGAFLSNLEIVAAKDSPVVENVEVYRVPGRFGGWPANHGLWSWGNEILVGFGAGYHKDNGPERHNIDHDKAEEHLLARSLDGGVTWKIENPSEQGKLIPVGKSLHGVTPPGLTPEITTDCPGGMDFTHPDFAMTIRMNDVNVGPSRFYYSLDRGHHWSGPFKLPQFGTPGIAARTDYIVDGKKTCTLFLTAGKQNGKEGRPLCVRTTDGGRTWKLLSFIGPEPAGFAIMPSTVRLNPSTLVTTLRVHGSTVKTIDAWRSRDDGKTWEFLSQPVADTGSGNPPSLIKLVDGRLCLTYGYRKAPYGIHATLSSDEGKTWTKPIVLRNKGGGRDIGYPRSAQRPDGKVVVVYYFHDTPTSERYIAATLWDPSPKDAAKK